MNRRQFTAALAMLPAGLRAAETQQQRGKRVMERCIQALGGDAFRQMPGLLQTGSAYSFYDDKISGLSPAKIYTKYLDAGQPFREVQRQELGKKGDEAVILTATEGWDVTYRGAEPIPADRIERFKEGLLTDIFYILRIRLNEPNMSWFSKGADVVENQPVEIVDYYDADNCHRDGLDPFIDVASCAATGEALGSSLQGAARRVHAVHEVRRCGQRRGVAAHDSA